MTQIIKISMAITILVFEIFVRWLSDAFALEQLRSTRFQSNGNSMTSSILKKEKDLLAQTAHACGLTHSPLRKDGGEVGERERLLG